MGIPTSIQVLLRFGANCGRLRRSMCAAMCALLLALSPSLKADDAPESEEPLPYPTAVSDEPHWQPDHWEFQIDYVRPRYKDSFGAGQSRIDGRRFQITSDLGMTDGSGVRLAGYRRLRGWIYGGSFSYSQADGSASPTGTISINGETWQSGATIASKFRMFSYEARLGWTLTSGKTFQFETGFDLRLQVGDFNFGGTSAVGAPISYHQPFGSAGVSWFCNYSWNVHGVVFGINHEVSLIPFDIPILVLARELLFSPERTGWTGRYAFGVHAGFEVSENIEITARFTWSFSDYIGFGKNNGGFQDGDEWPNIVDATSGVSLKIAF